MYDSVHPFSLARPSHPQITEREGERAASIQPTDRQTAAAAAAEAKVQPLIDSIDRTKKGIVLLVYKGYKTAQKRRKKEIGIEAENVKSLNFKQKDCLLEQLCQSQTVYCFPCEIAVLKSTAAKN